MQFRIVIQFESEEANALALDYLFLGIGSLRNPDLWTLVCAPNITLYGWRFEIFRGGREGVLLCKKKKQVMPPLRRVVFGIIKTASRRT
jgi:hypothetical protein